MEALESLRHLLGRPACQMIVGGFRPPADPFTSWFGRVCIAAPEETWPIFQGEPMLPLCQIKCSELSIVPEVLRDMAFLTLFIAAGRLPEIWSANGEGWLLRSYQTGQPLTALETPLQLKSPIKAFPVRWETIEQDFPCREDADATITNARMREAFEEHYEEFPRHYCSKVGGWPSIVQFGLFEWMPPKLTYVFQIDSEYKAHWAWGDQGVGYFGCALEQDGPHWYLEWQSL